MDVFVKWTPMECAVRPVMPCILQNKEDGDLICHGEKGRQGYTGAKAAVLGHWMEKPGSIR